MSKVIFIMVFAISAILACGSDSTDKNVSDNNMDTEKNTTSNEIDLNKSTIVWTGKKVLGEHTGNIDIKSANLEYDNGRLSGGQFVIDMTSIEVTDLEGEDRSKLEGHLRSDDFFSVENHKTAEFVITNVKPAGNNSYMVTGDLTIKGITHPVSFKADIVNNNTFEADIAVDRTLYDIKFKSGKFFEGLGDNMIYDDFNLKVKLVTE